MLKWFIPITAATLMLNSCLPPPNPEPASQTQPTKAISSTPNASPTAETKCAVVSAEVAVNLRSAPTVQSKIKDTLLHGEIVKAHYKFRGWTHITSADKMSGFINSNYLTESECK